MMAGGFFVSVPSCSLPSVYCHIDHRFHNSFTPVSCISLNWISALHVDLDFSCERVQQSRNFVNDIIKLVQLTEMLAYMCF